VIVANDAAGWRVYHLTKEEALNLPISSVSVNGHEFPYRVEEGFLTLDVEMPGSSGADISIRYGD
jgi:hypothetical protein